MAYHHRHHHSRRRRPHQFTDAAYANFCICHMTLTVCVYANYLHEIIFRSQFHTVSFK